MSLERKVLVRGNHDLLLDECCLREFPYNHDVHNGTVKTINDIGDAGMGYPFDTCCQRTYDKLAAYRSLLINYFETEHYIFVHSWIPLKVTYDESASKPWHLVGKKHEYMEDWREAVAAEWEEAMWGNPFDMASAGLNKTGKTIVFGHWHCSTGWSREEYRSEFREDAKWDIYHNLEQKIVGIDRCTVHTGEVNVLVLEDNFLENTK
jgi:hypothetical protein